MYSNRFLLKLLQLFTTNSSYPVVLLDMCASWLSQCLLATCRHYRAWPQLHFHHSGKRTFASSATGGVVLNCASIVEVNVKLVATASRANLSTLIIASKLCCAHVCPIKSSLLCKSHSLFIHNDSLTAVRASGSTPAYEVD